MLRLNTFDLSLRFTFFAKKELLFPTADRRNLKPDDSVLFNFSNPNFIKFLRAKHVKARQSCGRWVPDVPAMHLASPKMWCQDVDDLGVDYIVPSENGGRADVHWAAFTATTGDGLLFQYLCPDAAASLDDPKDGAAEQRPRNMQGAQVSASRLSLEELENTSHRHLLPKVNESRPVHVHLDTAHAGVGGVGEGGSKLWATATQFLINPKCGPWNFSVILTPIDSETWLHHATPAGA